MLGTLEKNTKARDTGKTSGIEPGCEDREPQWLSERRERYAINLTHLPQPNKKQDEWRKTLVERIDFLSKSVPVSTKTGNNAHRLEEHINEAKSKLPCLAGYVADTTGIGIEETSRLFTEKNIVFTSIENATRNHPQLLERLLPADEAEDRAVALCEAQFVNGALLVVPEGTVIDETFLIINAVPQLDENEAYTPRIIISAGKGSRIKIVNWFKCLVDENQSVASSAASKERNGLRLTSAIVDIHAEEGSSVDYVELQDLGKEDFAIVRNHIHTGKDARIKTLTVGLAGGQLKTDIYTNLSGRGAFADIQGVVLGKVDEHMSFNTVQNHIKPDTSSNIDFRIALQDKAVSSYQGNIKVEPEAQRIEAFQSNKNLILSNEAKADSIPRLEILADDVKCSHGATVSPIDKDQVFYLMSRGLSLEEAEDLVVQGFFNKVLESCRVEGVASWVNELLSKKIHS